MTEISASVSEIPAFGDELTPEMFKTSSYAIEKSPKLVKSSSGSFLNTTVDESASNEESPRDVFISATMSPAKMLEGSDSEEMDQDGEDPLDVSLSSLGLDFV